MSLDLVSELSCCFQPEHSWLVGLPVDVSAEPKGEALEGVGRGR
jgi:hypothetical protein